MIPLKIKDSTIGVISINKLLVQKTQFTTMDYELFTLLAGHAATAVFSAKLYSTSARKLTHPPGLPGHAQADRSSGRSPGAGDPPRRRDEPASLLNVVTAPADAGPGALTK